MTIPFAVIAKRGGTHPTNPAWDLLTATQRYLAINSTFFRGPVTLDVNSELAAGLVIAIGCGKQRDLDLDNLAHSLGLLKIPGAELLQVRPEVQGGLEVVVSDDKASDDVGYCRRERGVLLVSDRDGGGRDNVSI